MKEVKLLTQEEIADIIEKVAPNTQVVESKDGMFMIMEDVEALEEATGLIMDLIAEIFVGNSDNWGFSDEYTTCNHCSKLIKTSPDSYFWKPNYYIFNSGIFCGDCIREEYGDYLLELINDYKKSNILLDDETLMKEGFKRIDEKEYEIGHYGVFDDPKKILHNLSENYGEVIFSTTDKDVFHTNFVCWVRNPKFNLSEYMEETDLDVFKSSVKKHIEELKINSEEYGGIITHQTLISGGAGQYVGIEFLELIGVESDDIEKAKSDGFVFDLIDAGMQDLSDDLKLYCEFNSVDLKDCSIWVGYNDNDGAIDVFLELKEKN